MLAFYVFIQNVSLDPEMYCDIIADLRLVSHMTHEKLRYALIRARYPQGLVRYNGGAFTQKELEPFITRYVIVGSLIQLSAFCVVGRCVVMIWMCLVIHVSSMMNLMKSIHVLSVWPQAISAILPFILIQHMMTEYVLKVLNITTLNVTNVQTKLTK